MSCIICMDDIENILIDGANEEKNNLKNNLIETSKNKSLIIICKTCNCTACNTCMIQYVNEFKNTQCPACRLTINITPFLDTPPSNEESSTSSRPTPRPTPTDDCCNIYVLKMPIFVLAYIAICYVVGEEVLKNQLHIKTTTHSSFIFINIFVGMLIVNFSYIICCRCSCTSEERR